MPTASVPLWVLATVASMWFLRAARELLIPIAIGILVSYALEPVVVWLERHRVPRLAGTSLVLVVLGGGGVLGAYSLRDDAVRAIETLPEAARRARELIVTSASAPAEVLEEAANELQATGGEQAASGRRDASTGSRGGRPQPPPQPAATPGLVEGFVQRSVWSVLALAGDLLVVFFLVAFLLMSGHQARRRLIETAGRGNGGVTARILDEIEGQIQRFLLVQLFTAVVVAAATWGVLALMGVENAAIWGILAGVFNSIPYFGPVIVSGGLLVVGLVQSRDIAEALVMSGAALAITSIEGWVLVPLLMGKAERMSALVVFLGILLWTWLWGAWGTILAVPMLVVAKAVADHVDSLKRIGRLMAP